MSLGTIKFGVTSTGKATDPMSTNIALSKKWNWTLSAAGKDVEGLTVGSKALALLVYCFQHYIESYLGTPGCQGGECKPNMEMDDCYNRDGMVGKRTLELMGWVKYHTSTEAKFDAFVKKVQKATNYMFDEDILEVPYALDFPQSYVKDYEKFSPASDVNEDVQAGIGSSGQYHKQLTQQGGSPVEPVGSSFWDKKVLGMKYKTLAIVLGALGVGTGVYFFTREDM